MSTTTSNSTDIITARREKTAAALSSVVAAIGLTSLKLVVGILTNSLGILAEAAHSALDLVAALVTFFAVRISDQPADESHTYGHGKIENLSALFEALLLLITCAWIIYESIQRLFFKPVTVDASIWAFLVMGISIVVDFTRSRILSRAAKKHHSQALEADALHFSTDIWSSSVVILGLIAMKIAEFYAPLKFLDKADSIAALGVAAIVVYVSIELGMRTIQVLLDQAPRGSVDQVKQVVESIPGIQGCHKVRVRLAGAFQFVDIHVLMDPALTLDEAHELTKQIEEQLLAQFPRMDITIHPEPATAEEIAEGN